MKTEHEKLKEICDKIGYKTEFYNEETYCEDCDMCQGQSIKDVREIIFTQEFMDKFEEYINKDVDKNWRDSARTSLFATILDNLDNPTEYIYNLLK